MSEQKTGAVVAESSLGADLLVGAKNIGQEIGLSERQVYHAAEHKLLPIFVVGRRLVAQRSALKSYLSGLSAAAVGACNNSGAAGSSEITPLQLQILSRQRG